MTFKRVLITGGTGFVGANLARTLLQQGHALHLLVREGYRPWRIEDIHKDVVLYKVDFNDPASLERAIVQIRPDWVFHLAVFGAYSWQTDVRQIVDTNVNGTVNLLDACLKTGFEAFINAGSSSEYGFKDHAPSENEQVEPNSPYAIMKVAATHYCSFLARKHNLNVHTLRLYSVYGAYEEPTRFIPTLVVSALEGRLPVLVNPDIGRDYVQAADVCRAFQLAATTPGLLPGSVYNIGSGVQTSIGEVVDFVRSELNVKEEPQYGSMPERVWDTTVWVSNPALAGHELGWQAQISWKSGIRNLAAWFSTQPEMLRFYRRQLNLGTR